MDQAVTNPLLYLAAVTLSWFIAGWGITAGLRLGSRGAFILAALSLIFGLIFVFLVSPESSSDAVAWLHDFVLAAAALVLAGLGAVAGLMLGRSRPANLPW